MAMSQLHRARTVGIAAVILTCGAVAAQSAPVITNVEMTGTVGQNFGLIITGSGFGSGPQNIAYPYFGDTTLFRFVDKHPNTNGAHKPGVGYVSWTAGFENGKGTDPVTLDYMVWNDGEIQFCGFYGEYGQNGWVMTSGDKFVVKIKGPDGSGTVTYIGVVP